MTVALNDTLKVVASLVWLDGEINQNVYNCKVTAGAGPHDDQDVVDDMLDWVENMYANYVNRMSDEIDGSQIQVYKWDSVGGDWDEVGTNAWVFDPASSASQEPRGVAGLITMQTTDPDVQGKKYIPGFTALSIVDGLFSSGALTDALAFGADWYLPFVGAASSATFSPGVWSVVAELILLMVDSYSASGIPAYQRRRKNNVGI